MYERLTVEHVSDTNVEDYAQQKGEFIWFSYEKSPKKALIS